MSIRTIIGAGFAALALVTQAALPEGATRLAWIQSSGNQYIDTGIKLKAPSDRVHMVWRCTNIGQGGVMFGNRFTHEKNCFYAHFNNSWIDAGFAININHNGYENNRWMISLLKNKPFVNELMDIDASLQSITVSYGGASATCKPKNQTAFETIGTCTVMKGVTVEGGTSGNVNGVIGKLYSFQIYRDGSLLLDLVPVKTAEGAVGMCDLVSQEPNFFENKGTGNFTAGPELKSLTIVDESGRLVCSPACGGADYQEGDSVTCTAAGRTNAVEWVRDVLEGYVLQTYDFASESWGTPATNASSTYEYVCKGNEAVLLTWLSHPEVRLCANAYSNGVMKVNGTDMPEPADYARKLPSDYEELEYIQSSGKQYIDTGIKLKAPSDRVHMVWRCTSIGQGGVMFGNRFTHEKNCFYAHFNSPVWTDAGFAININHNGYDNNRWMISSLKNKPFVNELMDIDASLQSITVSYGGASATVNPKNQTAFETIGTCTVLKGVKVEGGTSGNDNGVIGKLYSFQIYRGNYLLIDLVPVRKNDGTLGMYDWVSGEFFGNAGEGSFTSDSPVVTRTDVHSEIWLPLDSTAKLEAVAKQGFLGWTGDVEESEQLVNPLEKTISRGLTITPTFPKPRRGLFVVIK